MRRLPAALSLLYRAALLLSPRHVRDRFADEQLDLLHRIWDEEAPRPRVRRMVYAIRLILTCARAGLACQVDNVRGGDRRTVVPWRSLMPHPRHAWRSIRRAPASAAMLTAVVALGVALAATVFALVDGVLFKPLPYRAPHELVRIGGVVHGADAHDIGDEVSPREVLAWQAALPDTAIAGHGSVVGFGTLGVVNGPTVWSRRVDRNFFATIGVQPLFGGFVPGDHDALPATQPAIISHGLWQRIYGGDAGAMGRLIETGLTLSTSPARRLALRVVGVLPRDFIFPDGDGQVAPDILLPLVIGADEAGSHSRYLEVIARVDAPARPRVREALRRAAQSLGGSPDGRIPPLDDVVLTPLKETMVGDEKAFATLGFVALVVMMLLVAVNVGGLVASRSHARAREAAARRALGASTGDLVALHLAETGLLTLAGTVIGTGGAHVLLAALGRRLPPDVLLLRVPEIDVRVVAVAALSAVVVVVVATLIGVRASLRGTLTSLLGQGAGAAATPRRTWMRFVFEAGQVAMAIILVVGGALLVTSLYRAWTSETGYQLDDTLFIEVRLSPPSQAGGGTSADRTLDLLERVRAVPGVSRAAVIDTLLLMGARRGSPLRPVGGPADSTIGELIPVSSGYFEIAGLLPIEGRLPSHSELEGGALVAVVSARTAREYWPGRSAVGQILTSRRGPLAVVGVVEDARFQRLDRESEGEIYAPLALGLYGTVSANFFVDAPAGERVLPAIFSTIRAFDATASIRRADTVSAALGESIRRRRFHAWLFGALAVAGLAIAVTGIFGLVASATAQRTREIGIRLALGSTRDRLVALLIAEQLRPVLAGVAAGGAIAAWSGRYLASLLYDVTVYDGAIWAGASAVVIGAAMTAALIPALRAARIDPIRALRAD
jgi:predicted permease